MPIARHFRRRLIAAVAALLVPVAAPVATQAETDGLKVTLCGTSGPLPVAGRAKPCVAVEAGGALYLVDAGPESTENLMLWRMPLGAARAVFVTHLHSDHIGDLGEFNTQSWIAGRPAPLALVGPAGTERLAAGFNEAYAIDHGFRQAHHEHGEVVMSPEAARLAAQVVTLPEAPDDEGVVRAQVWSQDGLTVTAIAVEHSPATPALAYRFDYKGRSVVISGDTVKHPPLAVAARGADVLIHEAQNHDMTRLVANVLQAQGQARVSAVMADTVSYHATPVEAAEIAREAGVQALVLYHLTQAGLPVFSPETFARGIEAAGFPDWRLAEDGMTIELPADSREVRFGEQ